MKTHGEWFDAVLLATMGIASISLLLAVVFGAW
jgi:hypothetical protein